MIFFSTIFILLITSSFSLKEAKNFLIEFVKSTTNGTTIDILSEDCLGNFFDYHFYLIKKNFKENNFNSISISLENIAIDLILNCPTNGLFSIFNETEFIDIFSMKLMDKTRIIMKIFNLLTNAYSLYNNNSLTGEKLGNTCGKILNLFKDNYTESNLLESDNNNTFLDTINEYFDIIGGIFMGMKKEDDGNESKCYDDILKGKTEIMENIQKSLEKMDKNKGFGDTMKDIIFKLIGVKGLFIDCNLLGLAAKIISKLSSLKEMTEIFSKTMEKSNLYMLYIGEIFEQFKNNNMLEVGKYIGKIISNIFDFYVK